MSVFLKGVILSIPNCQFVSNRSMMGVQSEEKQMTQIC